MARAGGQDSFSSERTNGLLKAGASALALCTAFISSTAWAQEAMQRLSRAGADRRGRRRRDHRHRHPREPRQRAEHQARLRHGRRRDHRPGHRRASRPLGDRGAAARSRRRDQPLRRQQRSRPLLGRRLGRRHSRPQLRPLRIQRPRHLLRPASTARRSTSPTSPPSCSARSRSTRTSTAEMIEGGLSGIVNLNTRMPFDDRGFHFAFSGEMNYGDFAEEWSPTVNVLVSNTWDTECGPLRPARERLLLADAEPRRRPPDHQLPDPRRPVAVQSNTASALDLPQSAAVEHQYDHPAAGAAAACGTRIRSGSGRFRRSIRLCNMRRSAASSAPRIMIASASASPWPRSGKARTARLLLTAAISAQRIDQCLGRAYVRSRARPFGVQHLSGRLPPERRTAAVHGNGTTRAECRINSCGSVLLRRQRPGQRL